MRFKHMMVLGLSIYITFTIPEYSLMFGKIFQALRKNGILYVSFKYGSFEGMRNGRYFTDMTEEKLAYLLEKNCRDGRSRF